MELNQQQLVAILTAALQQFREEIDPDITASRILTYLTVVKTPGIPQLEIANVLKGMSMSGVSRNVLDVTEKNSYYKPGPGLIVQQPDPEYRKRNLLYPTVKGQHWIEKLTKTVAKKTASLFRGPQA